MLDPTVQHRGNLRVYQVAIFLAPRWASLHTRWLIPGGELPKTAFGRGSHDPAIARAPHLRPRALPPRGPQREPPTLDAELIEGLSDETPREITREAVRLPEREREIVLGIVRQFGE